MSLYFDLAPIRIMVFETDLKEYGFDENNSIETENHIVTYVFYDIGRLIIKGKDKCNDEIYIEDYFELDKFIEIVNVVTGFKITNNGE